MEYEMDAIAAVDAAWGIGRDNGLLHSIPRDMKFFREMTLGSTVILGRRNLESFPGGKPLARRRNIVLSSSLAPGEGYEVCGSLEALFSLLEKTLKEGGSSRMFVIGGGQVYRQLLPYCRRAYITKMERDFQAEVFFPNLDEDPDWSLAEEGPALEHQGLIYRFVRYENMREKDIFRKGSKG